jgi:hypothetical protein
LALNEEKKIEYRWTFEDMYQVEESIICVSDIVTTVHSTLYQDRLGDCYSVGKDTGVVTGIIIMRKYAQLMQ